MPPQVLTICGVLLWLVCALPVQAEEPISEFQVRSFTAQCVELLRQDRFDLVAGYYHLQSGTTEGEEIERHQLASGLAQLRGVFGRFEQVDVPDKPLESHQFEIQSMTSTYWKERPRHFQVVYRTHFSRMGEGALVFRVVVYDRRLRLRSVAFALLADRPDAEGKKAEVEAHMPRFFDHLPAGRR